MIIIGDVHLGKTQDSFLVDGISKRVIDTVVRLKEAVDAASKGDGFLCIAGDVYDYYKPSPYVEGMLFEVVDYAKKKDVFIYFISGNHDCDYSQCALIPLKEANFSNVKVIMDVVETVVPAPNSVPFIFIPHTRLSMDFNLLSTLYGNYDKSVIVSHGHLSGVKNSSDVEIEAGRALVFDKEYFDFFKGLVFLGHIHKGQSIKYKDTEFVYTGSVVPCAFDEAEYDHSYIDLDIRTLEWNRVSFSSDITQYKHIRIDLVNKDVINLDKGRIRGFVDGKVVKISVYAKDPMQVDEYVIRKAFNEFGKVTKFETIIVRGEKEKVFEESTEVVFKKVNFYDKYFEWVESRSDKDMSEDDKLVLKDIGEEVLNKVLGGRNDN